MQNQLELEARELALDACIDRLVSGDDWQALLPSDSEARQEVLGLVAVANRIGLETPIGGDGLEFWGQSFVAGTSGQLLSKASVDREEILVVPVDLGKVDVTRTHWPFLRDRRIDAYGGLTRRLLD